MKTKDAIKHYGGVVHLASALNVSVKTIYNWMDEMPYYRQCEIEVLTGGQLRAESKEDKKQKKKKQ